MPTFDWIVVGNGLAGAAVSYELARQGVSVLLLERSLRPESATHLSYGGIPYWAATTPLTQTLFQAGIERQRALPAELEADTELQELDLLLTIPPGADIEALKAHYQRFAIAPSYLSAAEACRLEPLLNPEAIAGALTVRHGHVNPTALVTAYNQAFCRLGGTMAIAPVTGLVRIQDRITGVTTAQQAYAAKAVVVAAGGYSRQLLHQAGVAVPLYYTHAELIETEPVEISLRSLVMPAATQRFQLEAEASNAATDALWNEADHEISRPILDSGVVQFRDGHLRIGQISRAQTSLTASADPQTSEQQMRAALSRQLPALGTAKGRWRHCLVSFCRDSLPLVGPAPGLSGLHLFCGFSSPFVLLPPTAAYFAAALGGPAHPLLAAMQPSRFAAPPA